MRGHEEEVSGSELEELAQAESNSELIAAAIVAEHSGADIYRFWFNVKDILPKAIGEYVTEDRKRSPDHENLLEEMCGILGLAEKTPQAALGYFMEQNAPDVSARAAVQLISGFLSYLVQVDKRVVTLSEERVKPGEVKVTHIGFNDFDLGKMQKLYDLTLKKSPFEGYKGFMRSE